MESGSLLLEAIFSTRCIAPEELQLSRYLPLTTVRVVVDDKQKDFNQILTHELLNERLKKIPKTAAPNLVRHARPQIAELIQSAEKLVADKQAEIINTALADMEKEQMQELQRLLALSEVNPNIRKIEIEQIKEDTECLREFLQGTQLALNAIRVFVVV